MTSEQIKNLIVTILITNTAGKKGTVGEKGFSALAEVEYEKGTSKKILFDTGATGTSLLTNLDALDKDLNDLDCVVFSHGHWDHVWGIPKVLPLIEKDTFLFCHPGAFDRKWRQDDVGGTEIKSIHHMISPEDLADKIAIQTSAEPVELFPGVFSTGEIPRQNPHEVLSQGLSRIHTDGISGPEIDQIPEDLSLLFKLSDGNIVILTGCCHAGVVNTINYAREVTTFSGIAGLIGGLHLLDAPPARLDFTVSELEKLAIGEIGACHCTGPRGFHTLKTAFPDQFRDVEVGTQFKYPVS